MSPTARARLYYDDKTETLRDLFGASEVVLFPDRLVVDGRIFAIIHDVIILLGPSELPRRLARWLGTCERGPACGRVGLAEDIQFTFGEEWTKFPAMLPEYEFEFRQYFDLVDLTSLKDSRVCDLGCGAGRWSFFLKSKCRELVLVDFSEAVFVARGNLRDAGNALFFMGDLTRLPFRDDFADFVFCLGVLHHLPTPALDEIRRLRWYAPRWLVYLYYALDNRPGYFRGLLELVTGVRQWLSSVRSPLARNVTSWLGAVGVYLPLVALGAALRPFGLAKSVPLYEAYAGKSLRRIRQDVYDRFFTRIEQRVCRGEILALSDVFSEVVVSPRTPYWHFVCLR